jgi:hypothetical protein
VSGQRQPCQQLRSERAETAIVFLPRSVGIGGCAWSSNRCEIRDSRATLLTYRRKSPSKSVITGSSFPKGVLGSMPHRGVLGRVSQFASRRQIPVGPPCHRPASSGDDPEDRFEGGITVCPHFLALHQRHLEQVDEPSAVRRPLGFKNHPLTTRYLVRRGRRRFHEFRPARDRVGFRLE